MAPGEADSISHQGQFLRGKDRGLLWTLSQQCPQPAL